MKEVPLTIAQQLALWADQLRDASAMGLHFATTIYDEAHYKKVQAVAMAMLALATETPLAELEPLRAPIFSHPTPFTVGDGAVIDAAGRILLIRRADNGLWALPGGALEVGETPAEGVLREVLEETGVRAAATALVGVFDSRRAGAASPHHVYCVTFLCRPLDGHAAESPTHALETLEAGWFAEDALPAPLAPAYVTRIPHAFRVWRGEEGPFFDR